MCDMWHLLLRVLENHNEGLAWHARQMTAALGVEGRLRCLFYGKDDWWPCVALTLEIVPLCFFQESRRAAITWQLFLL